MNLSVSSWCLQASLFKKSVTVFDFIDLCEQNNINIVELVDCFWENNEQIIDTGNYLKEKGMKISSYSISNDFVQQEEENRRIQIENIKSGIDTAKLMGADIVRIFSGNAKKGIPYEKGKEWIIEGLRHCTKYAEERNIVLVMQNHGIFSGKSRQAIEIIEEVNSPVLKINANTGNFILAGEDTVEAVRNVLKYIGFVHLRDLCKVHSFKSGFQSVNGFKYQSTAIGDGEIPNRKIIELLKQHGYDGYVSIEYEGVDNEIMSTINSINYLRPLIQ